MIQKGGGQSDGICHIFMQTTITKWDANQRIQIKHNKQTKKQTNISNSKVKKNNTFLMHFFQSIYCRSYIAENYYNVRIIILCFHNIVEHLNFHFPFSYSQF